jgi:DNA invertase Pin-like site-specific DNA recombinase
MCVFLLYHHWERVVYDASTYASKVYTENPLPPSKEVLYTFLNGHIIMCTGFIVREETMSPKQAVTKAYGYCRVSTQEQGRSGLGLEAQRSIIETFAKAHGITLLGFSEEIQTGKGQDALTRRPKLAALLKQCRKEKVALIVARTSRLARNVAFGSSILEAPVRFIACDAGLDADRFNLHIRMAIDEQERQRISEQTKAALQAAKRRGQRLGNPSPRSLEAAREKGRATIQEAARTFAASMLPMIRGYQEQGLGLRRIADELNTRAVPTSRGAGGWTATQLSRIQRATGAISISRPLHNNLR